MCVLAPHVAVGVYVAYVLAFLVVSAEIVLVSRLTVIERPVVLALIVAAGVTTLVLLRGQDVSLAGALTVNMALLLVGGCLGANLGARIEQPGHLLAVAAISAVADLWSVYDPKGLSARMAEHAAQAPDALVLFALPWPMLGTPHIAPIIGAGDILFTALYLAGYERHGLKLKRAMVGMMLAYALGLLAILISERPVPLLPLLGGAALLADTRTCSLPAHERRTVWVMLAGLGILLALRFLR
jgi:hypothetical protein